MPSALPSWCCRCRAALHRLVSVAGVASVVPSALASQTARDTEIILATTTSVRDSRLLEALLPPFERASGYRLKVIAVGSGEAMALGRRGEADILIVHDPDGELAFIREGYGTARVPLMHNEFVVVGPPGDPAAMRGLSDPVEAFRRLAASRAFFVSRADRSGTHSRERELWRRAGAEPARAWYREAGQGMSATLQIANELGAYALTDVGTLLAHRYPLDLEILVAGDSALYNPYHILMLAPARFPWINRAGAAALVEYLTSPEARETIAAFGRERYGRSLFIPEGDKP